MAVVAAAVAVRADRVDATPAGSHVAGAPLGARVPLSDEGPPQPWFPLPITFGANVGDAPPGVRFSARGSCFVMQLSDKAVIVRLSAPVNERKGATFRVRFVGAHGSPKVRGLGAPVWLAAVRRGEELDARPTYRVLTWRGLYRGVALRYDGSSGHIEQRFTVAPGADPGRIRFRISPAMRLADGGLGLSLPRVGEIELARPVAYQLIGGERRIVPIDYVLRRERDLRFRLGTYDHRYPLMIEPTFSPCDGNNSSASDVAVDDAGNAYVSGTINRSDESKLGFVAKLSQSGDPLWLTYFSGGYSGTVKAVALEPSSPPRVDVAGAAFEPFSDADAFVSQVDSDGRPLWTRVLGGGRADEATALAVDSHGGPYVAGQTLSADFPATSHTLPYSPGSADVFVARLSFNGAIRWATTLGGDWTDRVAGIGVDGTGAAYVAGGTETDPGGRPGLAPFPTTAAAVQPNSGGYGYWDAFVAKLAPDGSRLLYSTFLGGTGVDEATGIAVDASGAATVTGDTSEDFAGSVSGRAVVNFPTTANAIRRTPKAFDGFVTKLDPTGSSLVYSTLLDGPSNNDTVPYAVAVDGGGRAWITGWTWAPDFPTTADVLQPSYAGRGDAFVTALSADGSRIEYSTFFGGSSNDVGQGIATGRDGAVTAVGSTVSPEVPGTLRGSSAPSWAAFILRVTPHG